MILFWEVLKTFYSWIFAITSSYEIDPQNSDDCIIKERIVLNFHLSKKKKQNTTILCIKEWVSDTLW